MTLTEVRRLLDEFGIRPSKTLGQNFLIDSNILHIILREADVRRDETVLEIGPGLGVLTEVLVERVHRVVAIEKDPRLCAYLRQRFAQVELIEGDAVEVLGSRFPVPGSGFKVVSNLPYSISTPILERLVDGDLKPRRMVVTLQREVAQRLAARPRRKEYGGLTLFTQLHYHCTIAHVVSPGCFYPSPRVDSAVVVLDRRDPRVQLEPGAPFHEIVRAGFSHRRKTLRKLLAGQAQVDEAFSRLGLSATARAEELTLEEWIGLANALREAR
ncbi:MAG TPA: 16S rRNA (adenine(1518)-N(6)/adenine(1519)-N(6))-dimethyltransferase RsmA [Verrucomicrobiae bacterium]|nr:16S rRNA (adenine(1518)-N(6)/adenine(1519)-N(6))-dimethyltransferase RsmA [Verrucomicrobiae bacterium]